MLARIDESILTSAFDRLTAPLQRRVLPMRRAYFEYVVRTVSLQLHKPAGHRDYYGLPSGSFPSLPSDIREVAENPLVAPILAEVPAVDRAPVLYAILEGISQAYRIPKAAQGRIPRRSNPAHFQVNRAAIGKQAPSTFIARYVESRLGDSVNPRWLYDLINAVTIAISSPDVFPPLPIAGDVYSEDEVRMILSAYVDADREYDKIAQAISKFNHDAHTTFDSDNTTQTAFGLTRTIFPAYSPPSEPVTRTVVLRGLERFSEWRAHHKNIYDTIQRIPDLAEIINRLRYSDSTIDRLGNRKGREALIADAEHVKLLAHPDAMPTIMRAIASHSEQDRLREMRGTRWSGPAFDIVELVAAKADYHIAYMVRRKASEEKRRESIAMLAHALRDLEGRDNITLAHINARLPDGFKAERDRNNEIVITMPDGSRVFNRTVPEVVEYVLKEARNVR